MVNRRDFVSRTGAVVLLSCVPAAVMAAAKNNSSVVTFAGGLRKSTFEALIAEHFYVATTTDGVIVLQLATVKAGSVSAGRIKTEGFTLFFNGVSSPALNEGIYTLEHGAAGKVALYLEIAQATAEYTMYKAQCCVLT